MVNNNMILEDLKQSVDSSLWVEKYKPMCIDDLLLEDSLKEKFKEYISNKDIPTLLFYGIQGSGKTASARIIAKAVTDDILFINASNESGIDTVRRKIEPFCMVQSMSSSTKIIILDEMEMASDSFQTALREMIERFYKTTRFILTCNFYNKVIDPLKSRTQEFRFGNVKPIVIMKRCMAILKAENVEYTNDNLAKIIKNLGIDIRKIINTLQKLTVEKDGKRVLNPFTTIEEKQSELLQMIKDKKLTEVRKFISENNLNVEEVARFLFNQSFEKKITEDKWVVAVGHMGECINSMKMSVDPEITLMHYILLLINIL